MILRFSTQPDSPYSQILRKAGQKKAEPNRPVGELFVEVSNDVVDQRTITNRFAT
jgi:hypothetical protein